jgi:hypothetical protein
MTNPDLDDDWLVLGHRPDSEERRLLAHLPAAVDCLRQLGLTGTPSVLALLGSRHARQAFYAELESGDEYHLVRCGTDQTPPRYPSVALVERIAMLPSALSHAFRDNVPDEKWRWLWGLICDHPLVIDTNLTELFDPQIPADAPHVHPRLAMRLLLNLRFLVSENGPREQIVDSFRLMTQWLEGNPDRFDTAPLMHLGVPPDHHRRHVLHEDGALTSLLALLALGEQNDVFFSENDAPKKHVFVLDFDDTYDTDLYFPGHSVSFLQEAHKILLRFHEMSAWLGGSSPGFLLGIDPKTVPQIRELCPDLFEEIRALPHWAAV